MISGAFTISLFLLGALGSLWSTVGALHSLPFSVNRGSLGLVEYCFERMDQLDTKTVDIMFKGILPNHLSPIVRNKMRQWPLPDADIGTGDAYASLCDCFIMSPEDMTGFVEHCIDSAQSEIPWWLSSSHFHTIIQDTASRPGAFFVTETRRLAPIRVACVP